MFLVGTICRRSEREWAEDKMNKKTIWGTFFSDLKGQISRFWNKYIKYTYISKIFKKNWGDIRPPTNTCSSTPASTLSEELWSLLLKRSSQISFHVTTQPRVLINWYQSHRISNSKWPKTTTSLPQLSQQCLAIDTN
jgi:hypothetical protein